MARTRRRAYPANPVLTDQKYGRRGNARGKRHDGSKGQSDNGGKPKGKS